MSAQVSICMICRGKVEAMIPNQLLKGNMSTLRYSAEVSTAAPSVPGGAFLASSQFPGLLLLTHLFSLQGVP